MLDMGVTNCDASDGSGCMTFYDTNQQSARLMFYHDHAYGITRLNVYAGEAAGYLITDGMEQLLIGSPAMPERRPPGSPSWFRTARSFPTPPQLAATPIRCGICRGGAAREASGSRTWTCPSRTPLTAPNRTASAAGSTGRGSGRRLPSDYGAISNPHYDPACNLDDPATWQYQTDPFCEPPLIPGTTSSLGRDGAVQRHADRQRHGLSDDHARADVLSVPHAQRGQRPVLQLPVVRGRPDHRQHRRQRPRRGHRRDRGGPQGH